MCVIIYNEYILNDCLNSEKIKKKKENKLYKINVIWYFTLFRQKEKHNTWKTIIFIILSLIQKESKKS